jgi:hypothetical protein
MGSVRRRVVTIGDAAVPRGRVRRLQWRVSVDLLVTLALAAVALGSSAAYQVLVVRRPGRHRFRSD